MKKNNRIVWFARGVGIAKSGPFKNQLEAIEHMTLIEGGLPKDIFVWPERINKTKCVMKNDG